jgi:acyl-CoA thioesterase FadM
MDAACAGRNASRGESRKIRPAGFDAFVVWTWGDEIGGTEVKVRFEILRKVGERQKLSCDGWFNHTMVSLHTGRAERIPDWILAKYSV